MSPGSLDVASLSLRLTILEARNLAIAAGGKEILSTAAAGNGYQERSIGDRNGIKGYARFMIYSSEP